MSPQQSGEKHNLVLVQAFPANSTLSQGAITYLEEFFHVHFIDLPGFHPSVKPLDKISLENYVKYVEEKIESLNLDNYILSGISFGFLVANQVKTNDRCLFIFAIEPYLGYQYISLSVEKRLAIFVVSTLLSIDDFISKVWEKGWFRNLMSQLMNKTKAVINVVIREMDPQTLIKTSKIVLWYNKKITFQNKPYVLLLNPRCNLIKFDKTLYEFVDNIPNQQLRVILTTVEHYPKDPTYEYFKENLSHNEIESLFNFSKYLSKNQFLLAA